jgi:hypothetical protein
MRIALAVVLVVAAAGCGTTTAPTLRQEDAAQLIALAHRIAGEGACGQVRDIRRLRARAEALVNRGRVPAELQEPLMSAVGALGADTPVCLPSVTASTPPPPATTTPAHGKHRHDHGKGPKHDKGDEG